MSRQEISSELPNEKIMRESFNNSVADILENEERFLKDSEDIKCGLEVEYSLLSSNGDPVSEEERNRICEKLPYTDIELGAAQLEMRTEPVDIREGIHTLLNELIERELQIKEIAAQEKTAVLRSGTNPFVGVKEIKRSSASKYKIVPNFHNDNRTDMATIIGGIDTVDIGDAAIIGITNSIQLNIEAKSFIDSVDLLNRSFSIGPMVVAAFGNARFLELKDTGIEDLRMIGWEKSHDTRTLKELEEGKVTRIGLPARYYKDLEDYFKSVAEYPFILNAPESALQIGLGLNWRDTRIKVVDDSLVVEFRPVSTQPVAEESFASMMFYLGRLLWSKENKEELLPIEYVKQNRDSAMLEGLRGELWINSNGRIEKLKTQEVLMLEANRAAKALEEKGLYDETMNDIYEIICRKIVGLGTGDIIRKIRQENFNNGANLKDSLLEAMKETKALD
jgi:hypothetical protein